MSNARDRWENDREVEEFLARISWRILPVLAVITAIYILFF